jgi:DNA-binding MarR family transcriptional regulator
VTPDRAAALDALISETVALFHVLGRAAQAVHEQGVLSAARRGVIRSLRDGPRTVPQLARARPVSRQHIQSVVNGLLDDGLVELVDNPDHRRSRLVGLTPQGRTLLRAMGEREARYLADLPLAMDASRLEAATRVLRAVREAVGQAGTAPYPGGSPGDRELTDGESGSGRGAERARPRWSGDGGRPPAA